MNKLKSYFPYYVSAITIAMSIIIACLYIIPTNDDDVNLLRSIIYVPIAIMVILFPIITYVAYLYNNKFNLFLMYLIAFFSNGICSIFQFLAFVYNDFLKTYCFNLVYSIFLLKIGIAIAFFAAFIVEHFNKNVNKIK